MVIKDTRTGLELKFFELTQKILTELGLELYDLEWAAQSSELRIFIMDPKTKTALLEDCIKVDRAFSPFAESETWMPENLNLEVSSPGLFRGLTSVKHFQDVVGEEITINLFKKIDEEKYPDFPNALKNNLKIKVLLKSANSESIEVESKGVLIELKYEQIKKANLETNINKQPE